MGCYNIINQLRKGEDIDDELLWEGSLVCKWACKMSDTDIQRSSEHVSTFDLNLMYSIVSGRCGPALQEPGPNVNHHLASLIALYYQKPCLSTHF